jgi:hypothetical protein
MLSSSLGLNLSNKEVEDVYLLADGDGDGLISYKEFIPVLKKVLRTVYQRTTLDWNDWCQVIWLRCIFKFSFITHDIDWHK